MSLKNIWNATVLLLSIYMLLLSSIFMKICVFLLSQRGLRPTPSIIFIRIFNQKKQKNIMKKKKKNNGNEYMLLMGSGLLLGEQRTG